MSFGCEVGCEMNTAASCGSGHRRTCQEWAFPRGDRSRKADMPHTVRGCDIDLRLLCCHHWPLPACRFGRNRSLAVCLRYPVTQAKATTPGVFSNSTKVNKPSGAGWNPQDAKKAFLVACSRQLSLDRARLLWPSTSLSLVPTHRTHPGRWVERVVPGRRRRRQTTLPAGNLFDLI